MADNYDTTPDPADDQLVPKQYPFAPGAITGIGRIQMSPGIWNSSAISASPDNTGDYSGPRQSAGLWGVEGYAGLDNVKPNKNNPGLWNALKETGKQTRKQFFSPPQVEADFPSEQSPVPPRPDGAWNVQEQPMGSNDLPPLAKPDVWKTGAQPLQYGNAGMAYATGLPPTGASPTSANSADDPTSVPDTQPGGTAAPSPSKAPGQNKQDHFGNSVDPAGDSILGRGLKEAFNGFSNWRDQNRMTLMALAGGFAGAPTMGIGLGRGFTAAANSMPQQMKLNEENATVNYFKQHGFDSNAAFAIAGNPALTQQAMGQMTGIEPPKTLMVPGLMGSTPYQYLGPGKGWVQGLGPTDGAPAAAAAAGAAAGATPSGSGRIDLGGGIGATVPQGMNWETMTPDEKEAALDKDPRAVVHMLRTGATNISPRQWALGNSLIGQIDPGWTPDLFNAQKVMAQDLEKANPSTTGGNLLKGMSSFVHLKDWSQSAVKVGGYSGPDFPGGTVLGEIGNAYQRGLATPEITDDMSKEVKQAEHAGQEMTSFYSQAGGSEGERTGNMRAATGTFVTPASKAGTIEGEAELAQGKIDLLLKKVLANPAGKEYFSRPENRQALEEYEQNKRDIANNVSKLRNMSGGGRGAPQAAPQAAAPAPQQQQQGVVVRQNGHLYMQQPDGSWKLVQ